MKKEDELQTQTQKESIKEIYQPQPEMVCDLADKECTKRYFEVVSDCV